MGDVDYCSRCGLVNPRGTCEHSPTGFAKDCATVTRASPSEQVAAWHGRVAADALTEADRLRGEMLGLRAKLRRTEALLEESSQREAELREMYARTWRWRPGALRRWLLERVVG